MGAKFAARIAELSAPLLCDPIAYPLGSIGVRLASFIEGKIMALHIDALQPTAIRELKVGGEGKLRGILHLGEGADLSVGHHSRGGAVVVEYRPSIPRRCARRLRLAIRSLKFQEAGMNGFTVGDHHAGISVQSAGEGYGKGNRHGIGETTRTGGEQEQQQATKGRQPSNQGQRLTHVGIMIKFALHS